MPAPAQIRLLLAFAVLALAGLREHRRSIPLPVVVVSTAAPPTAPLVPEAFVLEADFGRRMTPDDVARGTWALARGQGPGLPPEQAGLLLQAARQARTARVEVDHQRAARRQVRARTRTAGAQLAGTLVGLGWTPGSERLP